jgi:hypothetical protein
VAADDRVVRGRQAHGRMLVDGPSAAALSILAA